MNGRPPAVVVPDSSGAALRRWFPDREPAELPLPREPFDLGPHELACSVEVDGDEGAQTALLAAVRNVALVIRVAGPDRDRAAFLDQLTRVADVRTAGCAQLTAEQRALLGLVAAGRSIAEAADAVGVSRRTAHRRLDAARRALGVETVTEAVLLARGTSAASRSGPEREVTGGALGGV